MNHLLAHLVNI